MRQNYFLGISPEGFHDVAYTEWGTWSSEFATVVCVHGLTRNGRDFDELAMHLSNKGRYVLCPDVVGRGESSWFEQPIHYNFPQYVADMNALIARSYSHHVDWIGTSMGGIIGMMMAALPNTPIQRLVLNDIGAQIPLQGLRRLGTYAGKDPVFKSFEEAKAYCKVTFADFGILYEEQWDNFTHHSITQKAPSLYVLKIDPHIRTAKSTSQWFNELVHHPRKALEGIFYDVDLWDLWKQIRCPVLIIHGQRSDLLTKDIIAKMYRTHPHVEVYEIEEAGHAPALVDGKDHDYIHNWMTKN